MHPNQVSLGWIKKWSSDTNQKKGLFWRDERFTELKEPNKALTTSITVCSKSLVLWWKRQKTFEIKTNKSCKKVLLPFFFYRSRMISTPSTPTTKKVCCGKRSTLFLNRGYLYFCIDFFLKNIYIKSPPKKLLIYE